MFGMTVRALTAAGAREHVHFSQLTREKSLAANFR
jgi:hypothetical protein